MLDKSTDTNGKQPSPAALAYEQPPLDDVHLQAVHLADLARIACEANNDSRCITALLGVLAEKAAWLRDALEDRV